MHKHSISFKRYICIILAIMLFVSMLPISASAVELEETIKRGDHLQWGTYGGKAITWIATSDSFSNSDIYVDVITKDIIKIRNYHNESFIPDSFGNTSLYKWLNSESGFWSTSNFPEQDRYIRAKDSFSILSFADIGEIFSYPELAKYAVANYNGTPTEWWLANYDSSFASQYMLYVMTSAGQPELQTIENVPDTVMGVRPITTLNLDSFYIASGKGTASSPYIIRSVYNNNIKSLSVTGCALSPSFSKSTYKYTSTVTDKVEEITIKAIASDSNASLSVYNNNTKITGTDGSYKIPLDYGENDIKVRILAVDDFTESVYTITVTREEPENTLFVTSLKFFEENPRDELLLTPAFNEAVYNYTIDVGKSLDTGRIEYVGSPNSSVSVSLNGGQDVALAVPNEQGILSNTFAVTSDLTLITLTVTSENEKEARKYVINVEHSEFAAYVTPREASSEPPSSTDPNMAGTVSQPPEDDGGGASLWLIVLIVIITLALIAGVVFGIIYFVRRRNNMPTDDQIDDILSKDNNTPRNPGDDFTPANSQYRNSPPAYKNRYAGNMAGNQRVQGTANRPSSMRQMGNGQNSSKSLNGAQSGVSSAAYIPDSANMEQTRIMDSINGQSANPDYDIDSTRIMPSPSGDMQNTAVMPEVLNTRYSENGISGAAINDMSSSLSRSNTQAKYNTGIDSGIANDIKPSAASHDNILPETVSSGDISSSGDKSGTASTLSQAEKPKFVLNFDADSEINMDALKQQSSPADLVHTLDTGDDSESADNNNIISGKPSIEDIYSSTNEDPVKILDEKIGYDPNIDIFSSSQPQNNIQSSSVSHDMNPGLSSPTQEKSYNNKNSSDKPGNKHFSGPDYDPDFDPSDLL